MRTSSRTRFQLISLLIEAFTANRSRTWNEVLRDTTVAAAARLSQGHRQVLRRSPPSWSPSREHLAAFKFDLLCGENYRRIAHRSCLQQTERCHHPCTDASPSKGHGTQRHGGEYDPQYHRRDRWLLSDLLGTTDEADGTKISGERNRDLNSTCPI